MSVLEEPSMIGPGIAVAFVATVYGVGFANIVADSTPPSIGAQPTTAPTGPVVTQSSDPNDPNIGGPDAPEGKLQLIRHLTPELLWRRDLLSHANRVVALEEVVFAVAEPTATRARIERLTGVPARDGVIALPRGRVRVVGSEPFPGVPAPTVPWIAGAVLRTEDGGAAIRRLAASIGRETEQGFLLPPDQAGGAALLFV
ncbi:MAG: hypothetical protein ACK4N5_06915 [Myxococcales bacterium]